MDGSERTYAGDLRARGIEVSAVGARCAELAGRFYAGLHHFPGGEKALRRVQWHHPYFVKWCHRNGLASYDGNDLTRLVLLAHDLGIRVEVNPAMRYLEIVCHPRAFTAARGCGGNPTMEAALADWRTRNPARPEPGEGR